MTIASRSRPADSSGSQPVSSPSLAELVELRKALDVALAVHEASLTKFWPGDRPSFAIQLTEKARLREDDGKRRPEHLTSTASCFESLADQQPGLGGDLPPDTVDSPRWRHLAARYASRALTSEPKEWTSDSAAHVYCRVRALPTVLRHAPDMSSDAARAEAARDRLQEAFAVIDDDRPMTDRGLGERDLQDDGTPAPERDGDLYLANTFHAYWGLEAQRRYVHREQTTGDLPSLSDEHLERVAANAAWAAAQIGRHTALLNASKRRGDAQQLAFAVLADLLSHGHELTPASAQHDLYEAAIAAFFEAQEPSGRWPLSRPLFHYPVSGNAYCYTFETLTELLRPGLPREEGRTYRALLEPYIPRLFMAWEYAMSTRVPLDERGDTYGWSSTHHIARDAPEAWATAEVFSFGHMLRCLSGHVVPERAGAELGARRPEFSSTGEAEAALANRGNTWVTDQWTVGRQVAGLFLHPSRAPRDGPIDFAVRDPDAALIGEADARSAVLFGPPGTGKTTIVEALAGALSWEYVEILASDFLREGVDGVPAQADRIFDLLMQLDRCVVLFDEIDELIQDRTGDNSDPFGRFLTTSMLPKIAKLWKQRRLIFFVATNHVSRADPAITRTSRFDARIFVAPPGLPVKRAELRKQLDGQLPAIDDVKVSQALAENAELRSGLARDEEALGVLPLLRFDQIPELARRLRAPGHPTQAESLLRALSEMGKDLLQHEWQPASNLENHGTDELERLRSVYHQYLKDVSRDFSRRRVARVEDSGVSCPEGWQEISGNHKPAEANGDRFFDAPDDLSGLICDDGLLQLNSDPVLRDGSLLWFRPEANGGQGIAEHTGA
jgi:hypothetical protein